MRSFPVLTLVVCGLGAGPLFAAEPSDDERLLTELKVGTDGPALLAFFHKRILSERDQQRVQALIQQLGSDDYAAREQATGALIALGPAVAPQLKQATEDRDAEVAYRAKLCLEQGERVSTPNVLAAAVRVLADKAPAQTAEVLLGFAPHADSDYLLEAIRDSLKRIAVRDKKPDAVLYNALKDKLALRRALAVEALLCARGLDLPEARGFLKDPDLLVRLRVAVALIEREQKDAIPVLIGLLKEATVDQAWQIEDMLSWLAGEAAPKSGLNSTPESRVKAQAAWDEWWKKHGDKVNLAGLKGRPVQLGLTLVAYNDNNGNSHLAEFGRDNKVRWEIGDLQWVSDLQQLPGERVLITERYGRVTERNRKGEILWQSPALTQVVSAQRLADGTTMIATRKGVVLIDRKGETTMTYTRKLADVLGACVLPNGEFLLVATNMVAVRIDKTGKEVKSFVIERLTVPTSVTVTPKGTILVPVPRVGKVVEYDQDGTIIGQLAVQSPTSAHRLPNGHTIVGSTLGRKVVELDREGKPVSEFAIPGNVTLVRRR